MIDWRQKLQEWSDKERDFINGAWMRAWTRTMFCLALIAALFVVDFTIFFCILASYNLEDDAIFIPSFAAVVMVLGWLVGLVMAEYDDFADLCRRAHLFVDEILSDPLNDDPLCIKLFLVKIGYHKEVNSE